MGSIELGLNRVPMSANVIDPPSVSQATVPSGFFGS